MARPARPCPPPHRGWHAVVCTAGWVLALQAGATDLPARSAAHRLATLGSPAGIGQRIAMGPTGSGGALASGPDLPLPSAGWQLPARAPLDGLHTGLQLRFEISNTTSLSLKPRRSRVLVELKSQW